MELLDYQKYVFMKSWNTPFVLWCMGRSSGKALALDTKIPTPSGWSTMGELEVGGYVFDEKGNPTKVTYTSDIFLGHKCYKVVFEDGEEIIADADHLWEVKTGILPTYSIAKAYFEGFKHQIPLSKDRRSQLGKDYKFIKHIEEVKSVPTKCISVEGKNKLYLCGENQTVTHNTTLGAPFIMAKTMLIPNYAVYILAGSGSQSQEMFLKIEKIAKREIASFTGLTDVFYNETVKSSANTDGFTHNPASFKFSLYNGSNVNSLNGSFDNNRSKLFASLVRNG